jgi:acetolactate synthase-1/2/3 large subunit
MKIPDYIAEQLANSGVKYVFGIPGGPSIPYLEAFRLAGLEFILTSHEGAAAVMADVTARLTGVPGVCHATFGPGAANIVSGTGLSLLDRSPMIVLTSEMPDALLGRTVQMNINHQELFRAVTKMSYRLTADNVPEVIDSALRICNEENPGPVHIGLPSDITSVEVSAIHDPLPATPESQNENDISRLIEVLEKSRRPLLAIGLTAARFGLKRKINDLLSNCPMPVVLTPMAKGLVSEDHPCYAGVLFHALSDYMEDIYAKSDLIIGLGYDPVEYNYESWMPDVPLIHFNTTDTDMPEGIEVVKYTGAPADWFPLLRNLNPGSLILEAGTLKGIRDEMSSVFEGFMSHFGPVAALNILREELPQDAILTADVGSHLHLIGQFWRAPSPDKLIMTNGWSSMGFGIPAALSAQLNRPGSTVACVTGDGGFLMAAGEIMTARRYGLPVKIVVFSDGELNLIKVKQSWKDLPAYGTLLYQDDLFGSDIFLGIKVLRADSFDSMRKATIEALSINEPVIINAVIDPEDYKWLIVRRYI